MTFKFSFLYQKQIKLVDLLVMFIFGVKRKAMALDRIQETNYEIMPNCSIHIKKKLLLNS